MGKSAHYSLDQCINVQISIPDQWNALHTRLLLRAKRKSVRSPLYQCDSETEKLSQDRPENCSHVNISKTLIYEPPLEEALEDSLKN